MSRLKKIDYILITSLLTLLTYSILFVFRSLDDNTLTSWDWVFNNVDAVKIYVILILGIIIAYVFSKVSFENGQLKSPLPRVGEALASQFLSFIERNPAMALFLFSFLIVVPFWKEPEVIVDASRYFTQAKHLKVYGIGYFLKEWGTSLPAWTDLPLIPFLYGLIFKFLGESRIYIQIFTTFLFSMTIVLTFLIGKTLWDEDVGFLGGILLLGIPYLFVQVPLMLVDIPTMFFLTLSIFTTIKALNEGSIKSIVLSSFSISLTFFSKYSTWLMLRF